MENKKLLRLICVVLVQIAVIDIILGILVIKKNGGNKNTAKQNSIVHSSDTTVHQSSRKEAKASEVKNRQLIYKSVDEKIASLIYKRPVTLYYPNPDPSNNFSLFEGNFLSLIYSKPIRTYFSKKENPNFNQKYLSLIYRKPLFNITDTGDIKLAADEPFMQDFVATAYDLSYESCGKYPQHREYGITFSGKKAVKGRTVAVDPSIIPLGSLVYIKFPMPYQQMTGWYTAEDTGSKIKGKIIDIYLGESALIEARQFGRRNVEIMVVNSR